ncbi:hypothetical protein IAD21_03075 [Abditibacteriota bacterium]|nr:hypothetical protein IAD21_03075 [Abditibacteriota bacterium]
MATRTRLDLMESTKEKSEAEGSIHSPGSLVPRFPSPMTFKVSQILKPHVLSLDHPRKK